MPISSLFSRTPLRISTLLAAALVFTSAGAPAQTLARPGWAGSGLTTESWWRNGVFYRIDVRGFQDSNGDGIGDLDGVASRMPYLQNLGVDAILLDNIGDPNQTDSGFADVLRAALPRHIRVLVTLTDTETDSDDDIAAQARLWLTRGAAGIDLRSTRSAQEVGPLLHLLRKLTDSFPGARILLSETATNPAPSSTRTIDLDDTTSHASTSFLNGAQLTAVPLELTNATARTIRAALNGVNGSNSASLFLSEEMFSTKEILAPANRAALDGRRRAFALVLLATRGGAAMRYGQEIGMLPVATADNAPLMQWTPTNITPASLASAASTPASTEPAPAVAPASTATRPIQLPTQPAAAPQPAKPATHPIQIPAQPTPAAHKPTPPARSTTPPVHPINLPPPADDTDTPASSTPQHGPSPFDTAARQQTTAPNDGYGTYKPYVPPPRPVVLPQPPAEVSNIADTHPKVNPAEMPGFTSGTLPQPLPADAATLNAATEENDPDSLLYLYRRLIQLHHDYPTLRSGQEVLLDYDDLGAVVWVRQPSPGAGSTAVIAVCNLSGAPLHLSLDQELTQHHIHTGSLRSLLSNTASAVSVQDTNNLTLPAYGVFLGELYH